jgi:hypothetical protein
VSNSGTSIVFTAPHSLETTAHVETVEVRNAGVGIPSVCQFTYTAAPLLTMRCPVVPANVIVDSAAVDVLVNGTNFTNTCKVTVNGVQQANTVYVSTTQLRFNVDPAGVPPGIVTIGVIETATGAVAATTCPFEYLPLIVPVITAIYPDYIGRQGPTKTVTVIGSNFDATSVIVANRLTPIPTTFVSATELKGTFDPVVLQVGGHQMRVANGPLTNQSLEVVTCNCVHNPTVAMMDIPSVPSGGSTPTTVMVVGDNYGDTAKVLVDGVEVPTIRNSGGALTFDMPPEPAPVVRQISVRLGHDHPAPYGHDSVLVVVPPISIPFTYT